MFMHYGDQLQLDNNILKLVVYKHKIAGDWNEEDFDINVYSIYEARHIPPLASLNIISRFKYTFYDEVCGLKSEEWYIVTLKNFDYDQFKIVSIDKTRWEDQDDFKRLH